MDKEPLFNTYWLKEIQYDLSPHPPIDFTFPRRPEPCAWSCRTLRSVYSLPAPYGALRICRPSLPWFHWSLRLVRGYWPHELRARLTGKYQQEIERGEASREVAHSMSSGSAINGSKLCWNRAHDKSDSQRTLNWAITSNLDDHYPIWNEERKLDVDT